MIVVENESSIVWSYKLVTFQEIGVTKDQTNFKVNNWKTWESILQNERIIVEFSLKGKYLLKIKVEYYCLRVSLWNKPFVVDI